MTYGSEDALRDIAECIRSAYGNMDGSAVEGYEGAFAFLAAYLSTIEQERDEAREHRDLAIAHDTQPYPTAWAYEQVCRTDREKGEQLATLRTHFTALWEAAERLLRTISGMEFFWHHPLVESDAYKAMSVAFDEGQRIVEASRPEYERAMREGTR